MTKLIFPVATFLQKLTLKIFARWKVVGREYVPPIGSVIVVSNHQSNFDPALISASLGRRPWFLAKHTLFKNSLSAWFLRAYGAFPVNRNGVDIKAYKWALDIVSKGEVLVLFPEGVRSPGGLSKGKSGVAQLAIKSQLPILPVAITGTEKLGSVLRVFNPTGNLEINIGRVFSLPEVEGKLTKEMLESFTDMIMVRIAYLLPDNYRGVYKNEFNEMDLH